MKVGSPQSLSVSLGQGKNVLPLARFEMRLSMLYNYQCRLHIHTGTEDLDLHMWSKLHMDITTTYLQFIVPLLQTKLCFNPLQLSTYFEYQCSLKIATRNTRNMLEQSPVYVDECNVLCNMLEIKRIYYAILRCMFKERI